MIKVASVIIEWIVERRGYNEATFRRVLATGLCTNKQVLDELIDAERRLVFWKAVRPSCWQRWTGLVREHKSMRRETEKCPNCERTIRRNGNPGDDEWVANCGAVVVSFPGHLDDGQCPGKASGGYVHEAPGIGALARLDQPGEFRLPARTADDRPFVYYLLPGEYTRAKLAGHIGRDEGGEFVKDGHVRIVRLTTM